MKAKRTRWAAAFALIAYGVILIKFMVFKAIPVIRIGHLRFRFAGPHTGPGNFVRSRRFFLNSWVRGIT